MVGVFRDTLGQCQIAPYSKMIPTAITGLNANSTVAGQITLSWSGGLGSNVVYTYVLSTGTIQSVSGIASPVTITLTSTAVTTTTITLTASVLGGSTSAISNSITTLSIYKTPSVTSGLVLHSDFSNPATYSGTGATFYNMVNSSAQSISGAGSYSYSSGCLVVTGGNYIQLASYTYQTFSLWFKPTSQYIIDARNNGGDYLYFNAVTPPMPVYFGANMSIYFNGSATALVNATPCLIPGQINNLTFVLPSASTYALPLFCRFDLTAMFNGSISRIVVYNRALTPTENTQIYNDLK